MQTRVAENKKFSDEYLLFISSPTWRKQRLLAFRKWGRKCGCCNDGATLDVHHLNYRNLINVTADDLMPLCRKCHEIVHSCLELKRAIKCNKSSKKRREIIISKLSHNRPIRTSNKSNVKISQLFDRPSLREYLDFRNRLSKLKMAAVKLGIPPRSLSETELARVVRNGRRDIKRRKLVEWQNAKKSILSGQPLGIIVDIS